MDKQDIKKMSDVENGFAEKMLTLDVNGKTLAIDVRANWTLSFVLREKLGLTGTKIACDNGACGSCTALVDGVPTLSCMTLAVACEGKEILTIEGLSNGKTLHPLQEAWLEEHGTQCGFCAPGMIMTSKALLARNPNIEEKEVREALAGNICRCGNYDQIVQAVLAGKKKLQEK